MPDHFPAQLASAFIGALHFFNPAFVGAGALIVRKGFHEGFLGFPTRGVGGAGSWGQEPR